MLFGEFLLLLQNSWHLIHYKGYTKLYILLSILVFLVVFLVGCGDRGVEAFRTAAERSGHGCWKWCKWWGWGCLTPVGGQIYGVQALQELLLRWWCGCRCSFAWWDTTDGGVDRWRCWSWRGKPGRSGGGISAGRWLLHGPTLERHGWDLVWDAAYKVIRRVGLRRHLCH